MLTGAVQFVFCRLEKSSPDLSKMTEQSPILGNFSTHKKTTTKHLPVSPSGSITAAKKNYTLLYALQKGAITNLVTLDDLKSNTVSK